MPPFLWDNFREISVFQLSISHKNFCAKSMSMSQSSGEAGEAMRNRELFFFPGIVLIESVCQDK